MKLEDRFGRRFSYVRLSLTDACNFRCQYCLPNGFHSTDARSFLSLDEIVRLAKGLVELGVWKIRLTGGEPTIRRDFLPIVSALAEIPGIRKLALTTNGYRLEHSAKDFYAAGLRSLNVSVDSLDPQEFHSITGHDKLDSILCGIRLAQELGFSIKINVVLLKSFDEKKLEPFLNWVKSEAISVRFIELMETKENKAYFQENHVSAQIIRNRLTQRGWQLKTREEAEGPAQEFRHPDYVGKIGVIAPYSTGFCDTCNRLRITARGDLRLCLFGTGYYSLRSFLQLDDQTTELKNAILSALGNKGVAHRLLERDFGDTPHLASIGG